MSVTSFRHHVASAPLAKVDKEWFPRWIQRFAESLQRPQGNLVVSEITVISFLRSLRDNGTPAWQRLQAVRAVEAYQRLTLGATEPSLRPIRLTLGRLADQETAANRGHDHSGFRDERHLVGRIDPREPPILQQTLFGSRFHRAVRTAAITKHAVPHSLRRSGNVPST